MILNLSFLSSDVFRALPALVWHRQNWDILYPHMEITNVEISELCALPYYVAGFCDSVIESRTDLCDLFINLAATEITVPPHSRGKCLICL